jgi:exonuclease SbcC
MRGVRISSLLVEAFRGIAGPLDFDLRAPITLVFAPNGTGKTTMCEAVEWLLTGQVDRLRDGKDFDTSVLRSKFAAATQHPRVEANLFVGNDAYFLSRVAEGSHSSARFGQQRASATVKRPHELLTMLAPAAAANEAHHLTAINLRQRWLKGTRFLSAEALAALVDTDEETIERRTQVFADLLGIRHLLDAERQFEKYGAELSTRLRSLRQLIGQQVSEIDKLKDELGGSRANPTAGAASARAEAAQAAALLMDTEAEFPEAGRSFEDRLASLTAIHSHRRHSLDRRNRAMQQVEAKWSSRLALEFATAEMQELEARLTNEVADIELQGQNAAASLAGRNSERATAAETVADLAAARDRLSRNCAELLSLLRNVDADSTAPLTLKVLRETIPEAGWTNESRRQRRAMLTVLWDGANNAGREVERTRLIEAELALRQPELLSEEAIAALRRDAATAQAHATSARTLRDATAEPVERLRAAARDLLSHDHGLDARSCPVCAHDWQSANRLRAAIAATLDSVPAFARQAELNARIAVEAARTAREGLDRAVTARAHMSSLEAERAVLVAIADERRRSLQAIGLSADAGAERIAADRARLEIADTLSDLTQELAGFDARQPADLEPLLPDETPISILLERLEAAVAVRQHVVQLRLATLAKAIEESTAERDRLRVRHATAQQRLRECRQAKSQHMSELTALRAEWDVAAPNTVWSDTALAGLKEQIADETQGLDRAAAHLEAARAAWTSESRRARLDALNKAVEPSLVRQNRMNTRLAAASRAEALFHEAYTSISKRQIQDLARVVNPLFARMHANRVFDRINLGEDSDFLRWLAHAGEEQLDPGKDFSQGQRQDLALALFLARARSLGGTFFLDEPVTHLDDLNRVGLLDILRATVLEQSETVNLVITTASRALARHVIEKFARIDMVDTPEGKMPPLRVIELDGNSRNGVELRNIYPLR